MGDKLAIDVSLFHKGFHGDNCATIVVGHDSAIDSASDSEDIRMKKTLIKANQEALAAGIGRGDRDIVTCTYSILT